MNLLKSLCLSSIALCFVLILWGGFVHNTGSSLACPDWPLCYGQLIPPLERGIWIEHGHRLLASLVGLLAIAMAIVSRPLKERGISSLCKWALFLVIIQGMLGGLTVIYRLPTLVSTAHLALSMVFFATLILIYHRLTVSLPSPGKAYPRLRVEVAICGTILLAQILLGAFLRHSGAGGSCGLGPKGFPLCFDIVRGEASWWPSSPMAQLHVLHRYGGVFATLVLGLTSLRLFFRERKDNGPLWRPALLLIGVILAQMALGISMIIGSLPPVTTMAHLGGGALLLGLTLIIYLQLKERKGERITLLEDLLALARPALNSLVLATAVVGMILAPEGDFFRGLGALTLIALAAMGATTLNSFMERDTDALMERTRTRPLPRGSISPNMALGQGLIFLGISLPLLMITINVLSGAITLLVILIYLFAYTPLKRKTPLALVVGAIAGGVPPIIGWTAMTGSISPWAWFLGGLIVIWQFPHFLAISIYRGDDYRQAGIKVYPHIKGNAFTKKLIIVSTVLLLITSLWPYFYGGASDAYGKWASVIGGVLLLLAIFQGARNFFWASVFYLPLLLGGMVLL